jgi:hypothetical protein
MILKFIIKIINWFKGLCLNIKFVPKKNDIQKFLKYFLFAYSSIEISPDFKSPLWYLCGNNDSDWNSEAVFV